MKWYGLYNHVYTDRDTPVIPYWNNNSIDYPAHHIEDTLDYDNSYWVEYETKHIQWSYPLESCELISDDKFDDVPHILKCVANDSIYYFYREAIDSVPAVINGKTYVKYIFTFDKYMSYWYYWHKLMMDTNTNVMKVRGTRGIGVNYEPEQANMLDQWWCNNTLPHNWQPQYDYDSDEFTQMDLLEWNGFITRDGSSYSITKPINIKSTNASSSIHYWYTNDDKYIRYNYVKITLSDSGNDITFEVSFNKLTSDGLLFYFDAIHDSFTDFTGMQITDRQLISEPYPGAMHFDNTFHPLVRDDTWYLKINTDNDDITAQGTYTFKFTVPNYQNYMVQYISPSSTIDPVSMIDTCFNGKYRYLLCKESAMSVSALSIYPGSPGKMLLVPLYVDDGLQTDISRADYIRALMSPNKTDDNGFIWADSTGIGQGSAQETILNPALFTLKSNGNAEILQLTNYISSDTQSSIPVNIYAIEVAATDYENQDYRICLYGGDYDDYNVSNVAWNSETELTMWNMQNYRIQLAFNNQNTWIVPIDKLNFQIQHWVDVNSETQYLRWSLPPLYFYWGIDDRISMALDAGSFYNQRALRNITNDNMLFQISQPFYTETTAYNNWFVNNTTTERTAYTNLQLQTEIVKNQNVMSWLDVAGGLFGFGSGNTGNSLFNSGKNYSALMASDFNTAEGAMASLGNFKLGVAGSIGGLAGGLGSSAFGAANASLSNKNRNLALQQQTNSLNSQFKNIRQSPNSVMTTPYAATNIYSNFISSDGSPNIYWTNVNLADEQVEYCMRYLQNNGYGLNIVESINQGIIYRPVFWWEQLDTSLERNHIISLITTATYYGGDMPVNFFLPETTKIFTSMANITEFCDWLNNMHRFCPTWGNISGGPINVIYYDLDINNPTVEYNPSAIIPIDFGIDKYANYRIDTETMASSYYYTLTKYVDDYGLIGNMVESSVPTLNDKSHLYFSDKDWPDSSIDHIDVIIRAYQELYAWNGQSRTWTTSENYLGEKTITIYQPTDGTLTAEHNPWYIETMSNTNQITGSGLSELEHWANWRLSADAPDGFTIDQNGLVSWSITMTEMSGNLTISADVCDIDGTVLRTKQLVVQFVNFYMLHLTAQYNPWMIVRDGKINKCAINYLPDGTTLGNWTLINAPDNAFTIASNGWITYSGLIPYPVSSFGVSAELLSPSGTQIQELTLQLDVVAPPELSSLQPGDTLTRILFDATTYTGGSNNPYITFTNGAYIVFGTNGIIVYWHISSEHSDWITGDRFSSYYSSWSSADGTIWDHDSHILVFPSSMTVSSVSSTATYTGNIRCL